MRKLGIYFVIFTLVVSLCPIHPITTYAEDKESKENEELLSDEVNVLSDSDSTEDEIEYKEEEIVLFSEKSEEEIEFFEDIPKQDDEATLTIPDDTEAILLISKEQDNINSEEEDFAFIQYTYIDENTDNKEEITVEGYVHIDHIVPADEALAFKKEREEQELIEEEKNEDAEDEESGIEDEIDVNDQDEINKKENNEEPKSNEDTDVDEDKEANGGKKNEKSEVKKENESTVSKQQTSVQPFATSVLKKGDRAPEVIQLKKDLAKLGFKVPGNGTNYFGVETEKRVKEFQKYYSLSQTGTVNAVTRAKINNQVNSPFQLGKRHNDTLQLKRNLNKTRFGGISITTLYGDFTVTRVKQFQSYYSLKVTGIADEVTRTKIESVINNSFQKGDRHNDIIQLKKNLNKIGFGGISVTTLYGDFTVQRVKEFQKYYGLKVTGIADDITRARIDATANSPYQEGKRHNNTLQLKRDLNKIGFGGISVTTLYGDFTVQRVKEFQKYYGLKVTGIADDVTRKKISATANSPLQNGIRHNETLQLKRDLNKIGFGGISVTTLYGDFTVQRVKEFQMYYGLKVTGIADDVTRAKISTTANSPFQKGKRHNDTLQLKINLNKIGFGGISVTTLYGDFTVQRVKEFQKYYGLKVTGIADEVTREKINSIANNSFQQGDRHNDIIQLKKNLNKIGFGGISVTTLYGSFTAQRVSEFQKYYKLRVTEIADDVTISKINSIANSPFQKGKRHNDTLQLKRDLNKIGFGGISVTTLYGSFTAQRVSEFQKHYGLAVNGIADEVTRAKITDVVKNGGTKPINKTEYTNYNINLNQAVDIQMKQSAPMTDKYRNDAAYVSANYLRIIGTARVSGSTVNVRTAPNTSGSVALQLTTGIPITITGTATGTSLSGNALWYEISQNGEKRYIHSSLTSGVQAEATGSVNVRAGKGTRYHSFGKLKKGERVNIISRGSSWHEISYNSMWREPTRADVRSYLDPSNNDKFQHLRLDSRVGVSASELNKVLSGKGTLAGQGQAFINGASKHGVNEAYLIAHALLETGHGTSNLAKGVQYNGRTVYNMFGIGAVDSNPLNGGAKTAYDNGWFTPAAAIEGGAKWIGDGYIYNEHNQNTLYKMRWNPRMSEGYAFKQYATDIGWAHKQVTQIKNIYNQLNNPSYHYDIPRYR